MQLGSVNKSIHQTFFSGTGTITSGLKAVSKNRQNVSQPIDFIATLLEGEVKYQKLLRVAVSRKYLLM